MKFAPEGPRTRARRRRPIFHNFASRFGAEKVSAQRWKIESPTPVALVKRMRDPKRTRATNRSARAAESKFQAGLQWLGARGGPNQWIEISKRHWSRRSGTDAKPTTTRATDSTCRRTCAQKRACKPEQKVGFRVAFSNPWRYVSNANYNAWRVRHRTTDTTKVGSSYLLKNAGFLSGGGT